MYGLHLDFFSLLALPMLTCPNVYDYLHSHATHRPARDRSPPSTLAQVLDSPFARLTELMLDLVHEQRIPIPRPLMRVALTMMRRSVRKRAGFSLDSVNPLEAVSSAFIPALFGAPLLSDLGTSALRSAVSGCPCFVG